MAHRVADAPAAVRAAEVNDRLQRYAIPAARHRAELVIDRSRFICTIAFAGSADDAHNVVREVNAEFADATHHCWAFVIGPPAGTDRVGMSDDGEPHGTAGRPMLTVLLHSGVGDVVAVVTRYYGGVKLGTGGLVKAYGGAVQHALTTLPRGEHREYDAMTLVIAYANVGAVQQLWSLYEVDVLRERYETDVHFAVRVPQERTHQFRQAVLDATRGQVSIIASGADPVQLSSSAP